MRWEINESCGPIPGPTILRAQSIDRRNWNEGENIMRSFLNLECNRRWVACHSISTSTRMLLSTALIISRRDEFCDLTASAVAFKTPIDGIGA